MTLYRDKDRRYDVSVITSFYNAEKYIGSYIECILAQRDILLQLILMDDGSTDRGAEIAKQYSSGNDQILLISKNNSGLADCRNIGIRYAEGKYIYFLDVDDFIRSDTLTRLFCEAEAKVLDIVFLNSTDVPEDIKPGDSIPSEPVMGGYRRSFGEGEVFTGREYVLRCLESKEGFSPPVWLGLYRRDLIVDHQLSFESVIHEDNIWNMEAVLFAERVECIHEILHFRRIVPTSITHQEKTEKHVEGALIVMEKALELSRRETSDRRSRKAFHRWNLLSAGIAYEELAGCPKSIRKEYKGEYIGILFRNLPQYNIRLLIKALLTL